MVYEMALSKYSEWPFNSFVRLTCLFGHYISILQWFQYLIISIWFEKIFIEPSVSIVKIIRYLRQVQSQSIFPLSMVERSLTIDLKDSYRLTCRNQWNLVKVHRTSHQSKRFPTSNKWKRRIRSLFSNQQ